MCTLTKSAHTKKVRKLIYIYSSTINKNVKFEYIIIHSRHICNLKNPISQSAGAIEYTDCISEEV